MIKVYRNGSWYPLSGKKIYRSGNWITLKDWDRFRFNGIWYRLGDVEEVEVDRDAGGWFPLSVEIRNYVCEADIEVDEETGDETFSNYRWELISTEYGLHNPELDSGDEYAQWRYYTVGEPGSCYDFSIEVNPATGAIVGVGNGLYNGRLTLPAPGRDWYMDSVSVISIP